jgi:hypothetical protein
MLVDCGFFAIFQFLSRYRRMGEQEANCETDAPDSEPQADHIGERRTRTRVWYETA